MKRIINIVLLSAGILLSLTGCQKGSETNETGNGKLVRFSMSTGVNTRTAYSGEVENNKERIDWVAGDQVMIWSDNATVRPQGTPYFTGNNNLAVYTVGTITASSEKSYATINDNPGNGLQYPDNDPGSKFWGVYPAEAVTDSPVASEDGAYTLPFSIEGAQTLAANANTEATNDYVPDMNQAVMLAYVSGAKAAASTVELPFYPAFTAFEFDIKGKDMEHPLTIKSVELTSSEVGSVAATPLSGNFTATCTNGTWTNALGEETATSVKANLPANCVIDNENSLKLDIFALPQQITNLVVTFDTNEGKKSVKLTNSDKTSYINFAPCKKHRINGLILPSGWYFSYITLDLKVLEWEAEDIEGNSEDFPQATQFSVSGEGVLNGDSDLHIGGTGDNRTKDPYRQQWYFKPDHTVTVFFKVMLPAGGTWEVEAVGGTEESPVEADAALFEIKNVSPDATSETHLYGAIHETGSTDVKLEITYKGTDTNPHAFYFHTYAYSGADRTGSKFNIDSETQIYDRGRGFHTFFVNSPLYPNE